ncbi:hypothetical protein [Shimazuella alba]|uniref:Uncharacterized protein n=1 Tax=Shimazuella alba TaxID=2690964 RepID=A0A6I4VQE3_9BACL|nr:hypothetical protein [Shimazuella alba]MXQ53809.1 hypothetical protein [Shimazuella alba]
MSQFDLNQIKTQLSDGFQKHRKLIVTVLLVALVVGVIIPVVLWLLEKIILGLIIGGALMALFYVLNGKFRTWVNNKIKGFFRK